jgi:large subunit ribosomal protein L3
MKFILGTKENMTQLFDEKGTVHAGTIIKVGPLTVTQIKTKQVDGYSAVQVGFKEGKEKHVNKPQRTKGLFRHFREVRTESDPADVSVGDVFTVADAFMVGDMVTVAGISKGRGFQGGVKRHGFHGGSRTHGQKHSEREVGSIGGGGRAGGRVAKGMRMPGRMGGDRVTVENLKVLAVDASSNELILEGAVPGRRGTVIEVYAAK